MDKKVQIILVGLNILLLLLVGSIGFIAKDLYKEVRYYPNTQISKDLDRVQDQIIAQQKEIHNLNTFLRDQYYERME